LVNARIKKNEFFILIRLLTNLFLDGDCFDVVE